jgi:ferredoxin-NADP reductase
VDRYLELMHPMLARRTMRAEVVAVRSSAAGSLTLTLRPTRQWRGFAAGQFVRIGVVIDGVRHTRCYSPIDSEHRRDGRFELTVRAHDGGLVSQYLHRHARPGLVVSLEPADGDFRLPAVRPDNVVLISGGSGITPVLSMLRTLVDEGFPGRVAFLHYAAEPARVPHRDVIDEAARRTSVRAAFGYTRHPGGELDGHFDLAHLDTVAPWHRDSEIYVCGPASLREAVRAGCARVHSEEFTLELPRSTTATGETTFAASGRTAANTGASLLEQAEGAGLSPEHGCRMGICFSCTSLKRCGTVRNLRTGELDDEPDKQIQLCINAAEGDVTIDI